MLRSHFQTIHRTWHVWWRSERWFHGLRLIRRKTQENSHDDTSSYFKAEIQTNLNTCFQALIKPPPCRASVPKERPQRSALKGPRPTCLPCLTSLRSRSSKRHSTWSTRTETASLTRKIFTTCWPPWVKQSTDLSSDVSVTYLKNSLVTFYDWFKTFLYSCAHFTDITILILFFSISCILGGFLPLKIAV